MGLTRNQIGLVVTICVLVFIGALTVVGLWATGYLTQTNDLRAYESDESWQPLDRK